MLLESLTSSSRTQAALILLDKDTFEPDAAVLVIAEASSSKDTWYVAALVVRGLLRRPSLSGTPTVTFCSVHVHNVVAKKGDNSTALLRRLYAHMLQHNVDFIEGGFNMSAFSKIGDVFTDSEFAARGNSHQWCLGALDDTCRERTGFLIMPKRPCERRVDAHGSYEFNNADLGFGPRDQTAHFPVFLHLRYQLPWPRQHNTHTLRQRLRRRPAQHSAP